MIPRDLVLEDARVRLELLDFRHAPDLFAAGNDDEVWRKTFRKNPFVTLAATQDYIAEALYGTLTAPGGVPFAVIDKPSGKAIGGTRYFEMSDLDRKLEIGWTWLGRPYWRSHVNSTCKFLLLQHAFERAGIVRVQFKADSENDRSRAALQRLGAVYEGTLRCARMFGGSSRSISYYSILLHEWPALKARLQARSLALSARQENLR